MSTSSLEDRENYNRLLSRMLDQARHEATQIERKTLETAVRTLLENEYGAAMNVVRDDYPEFAELIDLRLKQAKREAFLEAAKLQCGMCQAGVNVVVGDIEEGVFHTTKKSDPYPFCECRAASIRRKLAEGK